MERDHKLREKAQKALLDLFSSATGFPIGLFELQSGRPEGLFSTGSLERFEEHCKLIQSFNAGKEACQKDQCHRAQTAFVDGEQRLTCCHAGIWNQASPVKVKGDVRAVLLYGETLIDDQDHMQITIQKHQEAVKNLQLSEEDAEKLYAALMKVKKHSLERLEEIKYLLPEMEAYLCNLLDEEERQSRDLEKVVHELQTRLQAIISLAENIMAAATTLKPHKLREMGNRMLSRAEALATVVNNLGEFQQSYRYRSERLRSIILEAWRIYEEEANDRNIRLKLTLDQVDGSDPQIDVSRRHMEWAMNNLVHNAIKYSFTGNLGRERYIEITGRAEKEFYVMSITNYGIGIKEDEIKGDLIFHDGYQGELTQGENRTGSGKGLSYVKRVIDRHNGKISVSSIPVAEAEDNMFGRLTSQYFRYLSAVSATDIIRNKAMIKKIVWIEDDLAIIKDVVQPLIDAGHQFIFRRSIKEATDDLESLRKADLILLDLIYPAGYNTVDYSRYPGVIFLEKLRNELNIDTPVIVFTVVTRSEAHDRLTKLGVTDIINKPVRPSMLKNIVEEALGISE